MSKWLKKGDKVLVIAGNERGKTGELVARRGERVVVQGVNIRKKHVKRQKDAPKADIIEMEMPMHISNVAFCNDSGKRVKLRARVKNTGEKELFYRENGKDVSVRQV